MSNLPNYVEIADNQAYWFKFLYVIPEGIPPSDSKVFIAQTNLTMAISHLNFSQSCTNFTALYTGHIQMKVLTTLPCTLHLWIISI